MTIVLMVALLTVLAILSVPGRISRNPFTGIQLNNLESLVFQRALAVILILSVLTIEIHEPSHWWGLPGSALLAVLATLVIVPLLSIRILRNSTDPRQEALFGQIAQGGREKVFYLAATSMYMIAYEILMRGVVLHDLTDRMDIIPAVTVNTILYAGMHVPKNLREALLCIPLGVFLCWLTIYTRSVWPAAVFHLTFALCFELGYNAKLKHLNT